MTTLLLLYFTVSYTINTISSQTYYVSDTGLDHDLCGFTAQDPCGTMWYPSYYLTFYNHISSVTLIVDGQNESEISKYGMSNISNITNGFHPCFPVPMSYSLTIKFNADKIKEMKDWYPSICDELVINITNSPFMFLAASQLIIYNLIINNYQIYKPYAIMTIVNGYSLQCYHCKFINISSECQPNTEINGYILNSNDYQSVSPYNVPLGLGIISTYIYHSKSYTHILQKPSMRLINNEFFNITYKQNECSNSQIGFITNYGAYMDILNSSFNTISTFHSLIHLNNVADTETLITMSDSQFFNINTGSILYALSVYFSNNIAINDISISTAQIYKSSIPPLFYFDDHCIINISNIDILYYVALDNINCEITQTAQSGTWLYYIQSLCANPISFIYSDATSILNNISITNDITMKRVQEYRNYIKSNLSSNCNDDVNICKNQTVLIRFNDDAFYGGKGNAFISNHNEMYIYNLTIYGTTLLYTFIANSEMMYIDGLSVQFEEIYQGLLDAFTIQSTVFILQSGSSTLNIYNSEVYDAAEHVLYILGGDVNVIDSICHHSTILIEIDTNDNDCNVYFENVLAYRAQYGFIMRSISFNITMYNCTFYNMSQLIYGTQLIYDQGTYFEFNSCNVYGIGRYYDSFPSFVGNIWTDSSGTDKSTVLIPLDITIDNITMINSTFYYYDSMGFMHLRNGNVLIKQCSFELDYTITNYGFLGDYSMPQQSLHGLLQFTDNNDIVLIGNIFGRNDINKSYPWIYIDDNGIDLVSVCLTGNTFINYAIELKYGYITSCFRNDLYLLLNESINNESCINDLNYGTRDYSLYNLFNTFILNDIDLSIFNIHSNSMVLDNSYFILNNDESIKSITIENKTHAIIVNVDKSNAKILIMDSFIINNWSAVSAVTLDFEFKSFCNMTCNNLMNGLNETASIGIAQLSITCDAISKCENCSNYLYAIDSNRYQYVDHFSAIKIDIQPVISQYYAGDTLYITYQILDRYNNIIPHNNDKSISIFPIDIALKSSHLDLSYYLSIQPNGLCKICQNGIYIPSITLNTDILASYKIYPVVLGNELITNEYFSIYVIDCPVGFGASDNGYLCSKCPEGTFNYYINNTLTNKCYSCHHAIYIDGVTCLGGDEIYIAQNYWVAIDGVTNTTFNIFEGDDGNIISTDCPYQHCCLQPSSSNGCNYVTNQSILCSYGRDINIPLCGGCIHGYSELFASNQCGKCHHTYYLWLLYPFGLAILSIIYVIISDAKRIPHFSKRNKNIKRKKNWMEERFPSYRYVLNMIFTSMTRIIIYYEQSISQILSVGAVYINFVTFAAIFNLSVEETGGGTGLCFIKNMSAKQEILSGFIVIIMIAVLLCILSLILNNESWKTYFIDKYDRDLNIGAISIRLFLLSIGKILTVLFKLLPCKSIGSVVTVHFYMGSELCYCGIWWFSVIGLIVIVLIFMILFIILRYFMNEEDRQNDCSMFYALTKVYKPQYYYWEICIFIRRILIAFLAINFNDKYSEFAIIFVIMISLWIHDECQPFIINELNKLEYISLRCIILIVIVRFWFSNDGYDDMNDNTFTIILLALLVLAPFLFLIWYIYRYYKKNKKTNQAIHPYFKDYHLNDINIQLTTHNETDLSFRLLTD